VGGHPEAEIVAGEVLCSKGLAEGLLVAGLACSVGLLVPGTSRPLWSTSPVYGSVWKASSATRLAAMSAARTTGTRHPAAVFKVGVYGTATNWPWSSRTLKMRPPWPWTASKPKSPRSTTSPTMIPNASEIRSPMIRCNQKSS
jgi:hypothetical protein